jgi:hypothetical protein
MVTTRPAHRGDVEAATRLVHDAYRHYVERIGRPPAPMTADDLAAVDAGTVWVAEDDGRLLGLVVLVDADGHLLLPHKGYTETHREERGGYHRVHFSKALG